MVHLQACGCIVLNDLVTWAHTTGRVYIKSDGSRWRPIVHIRDTTAAILSVLDAPREAIHNQCRPDGGKLPHSRTG
jgi:nucleoside-diphosphate-sugar epimerase